MDTKFNIKDLGILKCYLGFEIARCSKGMTLCQRKYNLYLLQDVSFLTIKLASTPMDPRCKFDIENEPFFPILQIQKFNWETFISNSFQTWHHFHFLKIKLILGSINQPTYASSHKIIRYIKNAPAKRSTTRFTFFLGNNLISWKTKK